MKSFPTSIILGGGLTVGLISTSTLPSQAATWTFNNVPVTRDCYVDSRSPNTNFCNSAYLTTGTWDGTSNTGEQNIYAGFDLSSIITDIQTAGLSDSIVRVKNANIVATQTSENPANPNGSPRSTEIFETPQRVLDFTASVTTSPWDTTTLTYNNQPTVSTDSLFVGGIDAAVSGTQVNTFTGDDLPIYIAELINQGLEGTLINPELAFAINTDSAINLPASELYPIEDLLANDMKLNLELEVFDDLPWDIFNRIGNKNENYSIDWEHAIRLQSNPNQPIVQAQQDWPDGDSVGFTLDYDKNSGLVTLTIDGARPQTLTYVSNSNDPLEGVKLFAQVETAYCDPNDSSTGWRVNPDTEVLMQVQKVRQSGSSTLTEIVPQDPGIVTATGGSTPGRTPDEKYIFFSDYVSGDVDRIEGIMTIDWPDNTTNPQMTCNQRGFSLGGRSRLQMELSPLTTVAQPELVAVSSTANVSSSSNNGQEPQSVPEPTSVIGMFLFGLVGIRLGRR